MTDEALEQWTRDRVEAVNRHLAGVGERYLREYFAEVVAALVSACGDAGATDWPAELHLADVIEKHLMRCVTLDEPAK